LFDVTLYVEPDANVGTGSTKVIDHIEENNFHGWRIDLSPTAGEKVLSVPVIYNGLVFFTTYLPKSSDLCAGELGSSRTYVVDVDTGARYADWNSRYIDNKRPGIGTDVSLFTTTNDLGEINASAFVGTENISSGANGGLWSSGGSCPRQICAIKWRKVK
jgi:Tfp pilus tip-associated adhesin PilY1